MITTVRCGSRPWKQNRARPSQAPALQRNRRKTATKPLKMLAAATASARADVGRRLCAGSRAPSRRISAQLEEGVEKTEPEDDGEAVEDDGLHQPRPGAGGADGDHVGVPSEERGTPPKSKSALTVLGLTLLERCGSPAGLRWRFPPQFPTTKKNPGG